MLGAIIGDICGSRFEFDNIKTKKFDLFDLEDSFATDDSIMSLAVLDMLVNNRINNELEVVKTFKKWGLAYPNSGYGGRFAEWLLYGDKPYNSYGNGSAMRVSAVAWYANSEEEVIDLATKTAKVTHNHPEGIKGAVVTAMCIYYARIGKTKEFIKEYVSKYYDINFDYNDLVKNYEFYEICQKSVPQAIYCFLISTSFEDCIRTTISIGGDCDTTSAISCAIAEAYYKDEFDDCDWLDKILPFLPEDKNNCKIYSLLNRYIVHKKEVLLKDRDNIPIFLHANEYTPEELRLLPKVPTKARSEYGRSYWVLTGISWEFVDSE